MLKKMIKVIEEDQFVQTNGEGYAYYDADMYLSLVLDLNIDTVDFDAETAIAKFNYEEEVVELPFMETSILSNASTVSNLLIKYE